MACRVCSHPERRLVEHAARGGAHVDVAIRFRLSARALERHMARHAAAVDALEDHEEIPPTTRSAGQGASP